MANPRYDINLNILIQLQHAIDTNNPIGVARNLRELQLNHATSLIDDSKFNNVLIDTPEGMFIGNIRKYLTMKTMHYESEYEEILKLFAGIGSMNYESYMKKEEEFDKKLAFIFEFIRQSNIDVRLKNCENFTPAEIDQFEEKDKKIIYSFLKAKSILQTYSEMLKSHTSEFLGEELTLQEYLEVRILKNAVDDDFWNFIDLVKNELAFIGIDVESLKILSVESKPRLKF